MTDYTKITETRTVYRDSNGNQLYRILVECTDSGDLSDTGVFVFRISDTRNALSDVFQRVATLSDLDDTYTDGYKNNRDAAVAAGDTYWRSNTHSFDYDDLDVAVAAVRTLSDRINTLVDDYTTYKASFEAASEELNFPTSDPTIVAEREAAYETAVSDFDTAKDAQDAALDARDDAQDALTAANADLSDWQTEKDTICGNGVSIQGLKPEMDATGNAFLELLDGSGEFTWGSDATTFKNAVQAAYDDATEIICGTDGSTFVKLAVTVITQVVPADIGKPVSNGTATGYLTAVSTVNASSQNWWVGNISGGSFAAGNSVTVGGVTRGDVASVDSAAKSPFFTLLSNLNTALANMTTALSSAEAYKTRTEDGITDHVLACEAVTDTVEDVKEPAVTAAQQALEQKETAYITAQAATQAAYDEVIEKYDAVKEVCPSWTPTTPLPAQP